MMKDITKTLIERGYPENAAKIVAEKLATLSTDELKKALAEWLSNSSEPLISSHGYSTKSLMDRNPGMTYPAALLTIDWLEREPDKAKTIIEKGIK